MATKPFHMSIREKYTSDQLSPDELEKLTATLLEAQFDKSSKQDFRRELAEKHGIHRPKASRKSPLRWLTWASVAAAVIVLVIFAITQIAPVNNYQEQTDAYLAEYFPNNLEERKGTTEEEELRSLARDAYGSGDFAQSAQLREQLTQLPQARVEDHFYLAVSYLYQDPPQTQLAIQKLEQLESVGAVYAREARWYLALALISDGQLEQAKNYLQIIVDTNGWQESKAAQLLDLLPQE